MKLAVVGCRDFEDYDFFKRYLEAIIKVHSLEPVEIVSGGAKGADSLAERWANENNIPIAIINV